MQAVDRHIKFGAIGVGKRQKLICLTTGLQCFQPYVAANAMSLMNHWRAFV